MEENEIAKIVVNAAFQIHKELGPGLFESVYESVLHMNLQMNMTYWFSGNPPYLLFGKK